ncbi:MAG: maltose alpha-D-glucosyltransferase [Syntrophaceae bacterium]|nr:maltose alpha-D-glucosyltransferase [Syntrophaceae bacterium]
MKKSAVNPKEALTLEDDPLWYKDAIIYELHVKAFADSDGDGIGDFPGLTHKLDYLQDLGVTALWLLPFCRSPLKDDGYDASSYTDLHPPYGTMRDFKVFLREAHRRGLRVITELVLNHTSDQHPWFQRARRAKPESWARDFYVWSDSPDRYRDARIIFQDFESSNWAWDPVAKAYYWHRFYSHQPDLNYDSPQVQKAMMRVIDFWFELGVDGLRLDAVPYLYEREGTNCENLPETHAFLKELRAHVDRRFKNRMLLAEANQWPEDAVAYFGSGDACHMAFHFPLMPRLFMALHMEDRFPILDILDQTPAIPETSQWGLFLRNHDELTLEMVTDEERDYMYRVYARNPQMRVNLGIRRRLAPLLGNHRRRIELMSALLFSMPGTPILYYGDEIGMGDNIYLGDRNGVRTPMQWSADRNAGFSRANPQRLFLPIINDPEYHYETTNVEAQQNNPYSLLWWMKRLIAIRKRYKAFGRGTIEFLQPANRKVLIFLRRYEEERILAVANLSRFVQYLELDLSVFREMVPVEIFGRTEFPPIGELPYFLTLGPHTFYWFSLEPKSPARIQAEGADRAAQLPVLTAAGRWDGILRGRNKGALERILPAYFKECRWFGGKARGIRAMAVGEILPIMDAHFPAYLTLVRVDYSDGETESYALPLMYAGGERAEKVLADHSRAAIARLVFKDRPEEGVIFDAFVDESFAESLLVGIARHRRREGIAGELLASRTPEFKKVRGPGEGRLSTSVLKAEQSNTSVLFGDRFILKLFRRIQPGINPDLEIGRFLTEKKFKHVPPVAGAIEYRREREEPMTLAILQQFVPNEGDAWKYTLDRLTHFFQHAVAERGKMEVLALPPSPLVDLAEAELPPTAGEIIGPYLESALLLGRRTAEMHRVLASDPDRPAFAPEPFSKLYQRSIYQSMRNLTGQVFQLLRQRLRALPEGIRPEAQKVLDQEGKILDRFRSINDLKISGMRIRCHGDYHLGQLLYTGKDFFVIDFEGEPTRPLSERRIKRSPLRDVAGMLRSFHYAAHSALFSQRESGLIRPEDLAFLETSAQFWRLWVSAAFLKGYLSSASQGKFLPQTKREVQALLEIYLLEKAVYELGYELNNRPDWVPIPIQGIRELVRIPS